VNGSIYGHASNFATVLHMKITLKLPDDLCRAARHRAADESKSLSAWVADLVRRVLGQSGSKPITLLQALGDESLAEGELELPDRRSAVDRPAEFP